MSADSKITDFFRKCAPLRGAVPAKRSAIHTRRNDRKRRKKTPQGLTEESDDDENHPNDSGAYIPPMESSDSGYGPSDNLAECSSEVSIFHNESYHILDRSLSTV